MNPLRAVIVAEPGEGAHELSRVLGLEAYEVELVHPDHVHTRPAESREPDLVLISAALGLRRLSLASLQFAAEGRLPTTLVFPEGEEFSLLEACVRAGYEYIAPPYLPSLVRLRLTSCLERGAMTLATEEMSVVASLHEFQRELSIAHEIQSGFLPEAIPALDNWQLGSRFRPAKEVSGDFFDVFELPHCGRVGLVVADVCDKGVPAALFMALIRTLIRHTAQNADELSPDTQSGQAAAGALLEAVAGTNRYLARNHPRQAYFATMFFGMLEPLTGELLYINAGHNPPLLVDGQSGEVTQLPLTGPAVGMMPDSVFSIARTRLAPGDSLFVYTDGVVEARGPEGDFYGMTQLASIVQEVAQGPNAGAQNLIEAVDSSLRRHVAQAEQYDDITMLTAYHRG